MKRDYFVHHILRLASGGMSHAVDGHTHEAEVALQAIILACLQDINPNIIEENS